MPSNWVNWGNPNGTLGNSNFGVISSAGAAWEMQLSLRSCSNQPQGPRAARR
jgi:hypothetical protein